MYLGCGNDIVVEYALYNRFDNKVLGNVGNKSFKISEGFV
jgi:hypothetical protein